MEALAHVAYVTEPTTADFGPDWPFLLEALRDPLNIFLIIVTLIALLGIQYAARRLSFAQRLVHHVQHQAVGYQDLRSWILRLSLGIAFIGAGFSQALISPALVIEQWPLVAVLEGVIGFLLLAGFLTGPAALGALGLYLIGLSQELYLIGNLETAAAAVALLTLGNTRPGIDNLLGIPGFALFSRAKEYIPLLLRLGLGSAFIFLALYEKILSPQLAALVVADYSLTAVIPVSTSMWVLAAGLIELALGLALLIGWRVRTVAAVAVFVLALSFFYFGEAVYSHVTLFGTLSVLFITGAGRPSMDYLLASRRR